MKSKQQLAMDFDTLATEAAAKGVVFKLNLSQYKNLFKSRKCALSGKPFDELYPGFEQSVALLDASKGFVKGNVIVVLGLLTDDDPLSNKPLDEHLRDKTFELGASHAELQKVAEQLTVTKESLEEKNTEAEEVVKALGLQMLSNLAEREELSVATTVSLSSIDAIEKAKTSYAKLVKPTWFKRVFGKK